MMAPAVILPLAVTGVGKAVSKMEHKRRLSCGAFSSSAPA
jgi:hypothetical protein